MTWGQPPESGSSGSRDSPATPFGELLPARESWSGAGARGSARGLSCAAEVGRRHLARSTVETIFHFEPSDDNKSSGRMTWGRDDGGQAVELPVPFGEPGEGRRSGLRKRTFPFTRCVRGIRLGRGGGWGFPSKISATERQRLGRVELVTGPTSSDEISRSAEAGRRRETGRSTRWRGDAADLVAKQDTGARH